MERLRRPPRRLNMDVLLACLVVGILCCISGSHAFGLYKPCQSSEICQRLVENSECRKEFISCGYGQCKCKKGFIESGDDKKCLAIRKYNETCYKPTDSCDGGQECTKVKGQFKCQCRSFPYNEEAGICTAEKILGQTCSSDEECYSIDRRVRCEADEDSMVKTCRCLPGWKPLHMYCIKPQLGDKCEPETGCMSLHEHPDNSTSKPVCENGVCVCPPNHQQYTVRNQDMEAKFCYTKDGPYDQEVGSSCQLSNECQSKMCAPCVSGRKGFCQNVTLVMTADADKSTDDSSKGMSLSASQLLMFSVIYLGVSNV